MHALTAIAYVSSATQAQTESALEELLLDARTFNRSSGVSGVLLHDGGNFFQYLEGPDNGVAHAYGRILASQRHRGIIELLHEPVARCHFSDWCMGFAKTPQSQILQLSQALWHSTAGQLAADTAASDGLTLLHTYWQSAVPTEPSHDAQKTP